VSIEYKLQEVDILLPDSEDSQAYYGFPGLVGINTGLAIVGGITAEYDGGYTITHMQSGYQIPVPERIPKLTTAQLLLEKIAPLLNWKQSQEECRKAMKEQHGSFDALKQKIAELHKEVLNAT
jgi:hypothetical protein